LTPTWDFHGAASTIFTNFFLKIIEERAQSILYESLADFPILYQRENADFLLEPKIFLNFLLNFDFFTFFD